MNSEISGSKSFVSMPGMRAAPQDADQQDGSERRGGIGSDRSHWLVPVRSRQVVRKPPRAFSSGSKDSTHRYADPIVQPHPGGAQDVRPSTRRDAGIALRSER